MADVLLDTEVVSVLTSTKSHVRPLKETIEERIIDFDWVLCSVKSKCRNESALPS